MTEINENLPEMTAVVIEDEKLVQIIEAALMVAGRLLSLEDLLGLFEDHERPPVTSVQKALERIAAECQLRGIELKETASGFRFQAKQEHSLYLSRLWDEKPKRYSRSLLETLALIAYRQPITRGEIEDIRGVACNSDIFKSLMERDWIRIVGHRDVPGRPALYATTRHFLDYFNMKSLDQLPSLAELKDIDSLNVEINFEEARKTIKEAASGEVTVEESVKTEGISEPMDAEAESTPTTESAAEAQEIVNAETPESNSVH
jgi:segregation and condensation protein B